MLDITVAIFVHYSNYGFETLTNKDTEVVGSTVKLIAYPLLFGKNFHGVSKTEEQDFK